MKDSFGEELDFIIRKSKVGDWKITLIGMSHLVDKKENWRTGTGLENLWTEEYRKK
jgi:hypothetical protein